MAIGPRFRIGFTGGALCLGLSSAIAYEDKTTGLKVNPPAPFVAEPTERPNQDAVAGIFSSTGLPKAAGDLENALPQLRAIRNTITLPQ
jgi:hypothetical protein